MSLPGFTASVSTYRHSARYAGAARPGARASFTAASWACAAYCATCAVTVLDDATIIGVIDDLTVLPYACAICVSCATNA